MDTNYSSHLADVWASMEGWIDERFITREGIYATYIFENYMVNLADDAGITLVGYSYRVKDTLSLLVVKAIVDGVGMVCFISARSFLRAVKLFIKRLMEGSVEWRNDRYA